MTKLFIDVANSEHLQKWTTRIDLDTRPGHPYRDFCPATARNTNWYSDFTVAGFLEQKLEKPLSAMQLLLQAAGRGNLFTEDDEKRLNDRVNLLAPLPFKPNKFLDWLAEVWVSRMKNWNVMPWCWLADKSVHQNFISIELGPYRYRAL